MKKPPIIFALILTIFSCQNQQKNKAKTSTFSTEEKADSIIIKKIFDSALTKGKSYNWLRDLTQNIGGRMSGSPEAEMAVKWGEKVMNEVGLDSVWLQPAKVAHWVRGKKEIAHYSINGKKINIAVTALGGSVATPKNGVTAEVIEVKSIKEAQDLGEKLRGKIVFFNRPFNNAIVNTFSAYGGCVDQRTSGTGVVSKFGPKAVLVRSVTNKIDNYPHTGIMRYGDTPKDQYVPAAAISTLAAEKLSLDLKKNPNLKVYLKQSCKNLPKANSFNVIGEIKGRENPEKIMVVSGHLDSWDLAEGAHDDGAGVVQALEVLHLFKINNIKPKNTIRVVFFMDEEQGKGGPNAYAESVKLKKEVHIGALDADSGGHTPRGFTINANEQNTKHLQSWKKLLSPYGLHDLIKGGSGSNIRKLKGETVTLVGYTPDSQRYFDYHHTAIDTFDKVNKRELELGSASMASLVYLMDKYLNNPNTVKQ